MNTAYLNSTEVDALSGDDEGDAYGQSLWVNIMNCTFSVCGGNLGPH
jgi:hypothetical protein